MPDDRVTPEPSLEIIRFALFFITSDTALITVVVNRPATFSGRWRVDGGAWSSLGGSRTISEAIFRLILGDHFHNLDVELSATAGDKTVSISRYVQVAPVDPTISSVVASPSTLGKGQTVKIKVSGTDFGPAAGGKLQIMHPDGRLSGEFGGDLTGGQDFGIDWRDELVVLTIGGTWTQEYEARQHPFKARIVHKGGTQSNIVSGNFTVTG